MNQSIKIPVKDKVISKQNLIKFGELLFRLYENDFEKFKDSFDREDSDPKEYYRGKFTISIQCNDGTNYTSESLDILTEQDILDFKKAESISISFSGQYRSKYVDFNITEGSSGNITRINTITISGDEVTWVRGTSEEIREILAHIKPQENIVIKYKRIISIISGIILSYLSLWSISLLLSLLMKQGVMNLEQTGATDDSWIIRLVLYVLTFAMPFSFMINTQIKNLWHSVEFDFGPEHLQVNKAKRNLIATGFIGVGFPIILFILDKFTS
jgi:hypothetical protein